MVTPQRGRVKLFYTSQIVLGIFLWEQFILTAFHGRIIYAKSFIKEYLMVKKSLFILIENVNHFFRQENQLTLTGVL